MPKQLRCACRLQLGPWFGSRRYGFSGSGCFSTATQIQPLRSRNHNHNAPGRIDASGFVTPDVPFITSVTKTNNAVSLDWLSISGKTYQVDFKLNLTNASWTTLTTNVTTSGSTASYTDTTATDGRRFYRAVQLP